LLASRRYRLAAVERKFRSAFRRKALHGPPLSNALSGFSGFGLIAGNTVFASLAMFAPRRRGLTELTPYGLTVPVYWLLVSLAALRALWQLARNPFYCDKTPHGLSAISPVMPP
jgi:hypothetical protein